MASSTPQRVVERLLGQAGTTYAEEAGIRLRDKPMPLFQLLILCMLASKPIDAAIAMRAARELYRAGLRTPRAMLSAERSTLISTFGRARYVRYDESSATRAVDIAAAVTEAYGGDLRRLATASGCDIAAASRLLQEFKGIGATGADIFLREVQDIWTWVRPYFDDRAIATAAELGLPDDPAELASLAPRRSATLAAALVRVSLNGDLRAQLR
ncbi:endonuclease [Mycolicibacterium pyrenivorans]|uniref:endonuclease n=1 Tax=Mycolicibacterium pyrenivorans TaxID=187102 RepID=UPI0021F369CF|nr:endonuclease [Mycolicibacterium pyrenivorans]MCV7153563.1 endonuclease [Mycolicibacterium pyrenivorans]